MKLPTLVRLMPRLRMLELVFMAKCIIFKHRGNFFVILPFRNWMHVNLITAKIAVGNIVYCVMEHILPSLVFLYRVNITPTLQGTRIVFYQFYRRYLIVQRAGTLTYDLNIKYASIFKLYNFCFIHLCGVCFTKYWNKYCLTLYGVRGRGSSFITITILRASQTKTRGLIPDRDGYFSLLHGV
jgi:hypothetical protein